MQLPLIEPARTEKLLQWHPEENEGVLQRMCRRAVMFIMTANANHAAGFRVPTRPSRFWMLANCATFGQALFPASAAYALLYAAAAHRAGSNREAFTVASRGKRGSVAAYVPQSCHEPGKSNQ